MDAFYNKSRAIAKKPQCSVLILMPNDWLLLCIPSNGRIKFYPWLRFSRNRKAIETSNLVETAGQE